MTLFESPFVDSGLSETENNALRASSLLVVPTPPTDIQPLEGLQGTNLTKANLTQWASYVQDVASGMWRPPHAAMECPKWVRLEIRESHWGWLLPPLLWPGQHLWMCRGNSSGPSQLGSMTLWTLPQPSCASMASSMMTTASTSMRGVSPTMGPPPGFPTIGVPEPMDVSPGYNMLAHARVGRGLQPQSMLGSAGPWAPGAIGLCQPQPSAPPSTSCCLRRSRGTSGHPVPASRTPTLAGEVCLSHHQG